MSLQVGAEDRHLEIVGALVVLVVHEQHADELLADIDLGGIILLRPRPYLNARVVEQPFQIHVDLFDVLHIHGECLMAPRLWFW